MKTGHVFLLCLAWLAVWWQPGIFMNDEVAQVAAMTSLADGHLVTHGDLPPGYAPLMMEPFRHASIPDPGETGGFVGTVPTMLVAMPVLGVMQLLASGLGVMGSVGVLAGIVIGSCVGVLTRNHRAPGWIGVVLGLSVALPAMAMRTEYQASPMLEVAALQFVSMLCVAGAGALVYSVAKSVAGRGAGVVAVVLLVACSPAFFWAQNIKYHAGTIFAVALGLYAARAATNGRRHAWMLAGLATGLGFWIHAPTGLAMIGATGLAGLVAMIRGRTWRPVAALGPFTLAILPDILQRLYYRAILANPRYFQDSTRGTGVAAGMADGVLAMTSSTIAPLIEWPALLVQLLVYLPYLNDADPIPVLLLAPFLVFALHSWKWTSTSTWAVTLILLVVIGGGQRLIIIGAGLDQRYIAALWPVLVVAAALTLSRCLPRDSRFAWRWAAWTGIAVVWTCILAGVLHVAGIYPAGFATALVPLRIVAPYAFLVVTGLLLFHGRFGVTGSGAAALAFIFPATLWLVVALTGALHAQATPYAVWPIQVLYQLLSGIAGIPHEPAFDF